MSFRLYSWSSTQGWDAKQAEDRPMNEWLENLHKLFQFVFEVWPQDHLVFKA
jgi:hypothetical protein